MVLFVILGGQLHYTIRNQKMNLKKLNLAHLKLINFMRRLFTIQQYF